MCGGGEGCRRSPRVGRVVRVLEAEAGEAEARPVPGPRHREARDAALGVAALLVGGGQRQPLAPTSSSNESTSEGNGVEARVANILAVSAQLSMTVVLGALLVQRSSDCATTALDSPGLEDQLTLRRLHVVTASI